MSAGAPTVGEVLTCTNGTWSNSPVSYAYQWQSSYDAEGWSDIVGSTANTFTVTSDLINLYLRCEVTATNQGGSVEVASTATGYVATGFASMTTYDSGFTMGSGATEASGAVTCAMNTSFTGYFYSNTPASIVNSSIVTQISGITAGDGTQSYAFKLQDAQLLSATQNALGFKLLNNVLTPYKTVAGTTTNGTGITLTNSTIYLKIAESSGVVTWSYSTDGSTWLSAQTMADPFSATILNAMYIESSNGYTGTNTASNAVYSNLNNFQPIASSSTSPLKYTPPGYPSYTGYVTLNVSATTGFNTALDNATDYIIQMPNSVVQATVKLNGGRNVVLIGGAIQLNSSANGTDCALFVTDSGANAPVSGRTVHVEGVNVTGGNVLGTSDGGPGTGDGFDYSAPTANIHFQNCKATGLSGYHSTGTPSYHSDISQNQGGALSVKYDHFTGTTNYQGFFCNPTPTAIGTAGVTISNTDLSFWEAALPGSTITILLWNQANTTAPNGLGYTNISLLENVVFSNSRSGQNVVSTVYVPPGVTGVSAQESGTNITFTGMNITGNLIDGNADPTAIPSGGFCASDAGLSYVSPGYA
jgi:hypothetical protein